jgi:hypothetical protein
MACEYGNKHYNDLMIAGFGSAPRTAKDLNREAETIKAIVENEELKSKVNDEKYYLEDFNVILNKNFNFNTSSVSGLNSIAKAVIATAMGLYVLKNDIYIIIFGVLCLIFVHMKYKKLKASVEEPNIEGFEPEDAEPEEPENVEQRMQRRRETDMMMVEKGYATRFADRKYLINPHLLP